MGSAKCTVDLLRAANKFEGMECQLARQGTF